MTTAILAMVLYPEAAKKAQAEVDSVVGNLRLPNFEDRPSLPYVEAFYREVMRWRPVAPIGEVLIRSWQRLLIEFFADILRRYSTQFDKG